MNINTSSANNIHDPRCLRANTAACQHDIPSSISITNATTQLEVATSSTFPSYDAHIAATTFGCRCGASA
jgi:hypothetical protein